MAQQIRKYYKDFNAETVMENKDKLEVARVIFYLDNNMMVFADFSDEENLERVKDMLESKQDVDISDVYSSPDRRELHIPFNNIKMSEINEGVILTQEDFQRNANQSDATQRG